jgi:CRP/FNR family transcriptional regulator, nitrogen oxide reductase regulator
MYKASSVAISRKTCCRYTEPKAVGALQPSTTSAVQWDALALEWVRHSPLFAGLPAAIETELATSALQRSFSNRQIIFRQGDPVEYVHTIGSGTVKITHSNEAGSEVILRLDHAGSLIDGMNSAGGATHDISAVAVGPSCVLSWSPEKFAEFTDRFPGIQRNATRILLMRVRMLENTLCDLGTACVSQRLARALLRLTEQESHNYPSVGFSREELAQMVGTSLFMVSRILAAWAESGIVYVTCEEIVIEDRESLVRLAETDERPRVDSRSRVFYLA